MERRAGPDLEIAFEEDCALIHADLALAPMHRIGRIGVDERAGRNQHRALGLGQYLGRRRRREHEWKEEESKRDPETGSKQPTDQKNNETTPESTHGGSSAIEPSMMRNTRGPLQMLRGQSALGSRRTVNSIRSPGSTRQLSISVW